MKKAPSPAYLIDRHAPDRQTLLELTRQYGTPLYIYDHDILASRYYKLREFLPDFVTLYYSVKANPNLEIIRAFSRLGTGFETASIGEVEAVCKVSEPNKIIFVGPCKTDSDLEEAISANIYIAVESINEMQRVNAICKQKNIVLPVAVRINPGKGNGAVSMGGDTQFGIDVDVLMGARPFFQSCQNIRINGFHFYLGTNIMIENFIIENMKLILDTTQKLIEDLDIELEFLDIGGGLGIPYYNGDKEMDLGAIQDEFLSLLHTFYKSKPSLTKIVFEAGRYLVGPCGMFMASVIDIKTSFGKKYIILDGGTNVFTINPRNCGFKWLPFQVLSHTEVKDVFTICGPLCTPADRLAVDVFCTVPELGDVVAFYQAGAYGYSAAGGLFMSRGFPKEIFLPGKKPAPAKDGSGQGKGVQ